MKQPDLERLAELYDAWINRTPPTFAGQYDEILPLVGFDGKPLKASAKVTWNVLRDRYEMEAVEKDSDGVVKIAHLDLLSENYPKFLEIWAEAGINTFHRVLVDGKEPNKPSPSTLGELFTLTDPRGIRQ